jgi:hypothetical protein
MSYGYIVRSGDVLATGFDAICGEKSFADDMITR